jgi:hypothetical protein
MPRTKLTVLLCALAGLQLAAQVLTPFEVKDPAAHKLQQKWITQLKDMGTAIEKHQFPYNFYLSRVMDLDEKQQIRADQRSIRFEKFNSQMVLAITGNYYAAYSDSLMDKGKRVQKTFDDVVMPILQAAVPRLASDDGFVAFAIEVSHHVRRRVMGVEAENPENVTFILPRAAAHHLVTAANPEQQQAALLDSQIYVDAEPFSLWVNGNIPSEKNASQTQSKEPVRVASLASPPSSAPEPSVSSALVKGTPMPARLITPETLKTLTRTHADAIARMVSDLDSQAHFVSYAPPAFVAFHEGAYLEVSISTPVAAHPGASRYQLAALAFDEHISHLVRPALAYFPANSSFDGIAFSTALKQADGTSSQAIEFFLPFQALQCFAQYDCTGQQLLDSGIVLINGERAGLNLQAAEAAGAR